ADRLRPHRQADRGDAVMSEWAEKALAALATLRKPLEALDVPPATTTAANLAAVFAALDLRPSLLEKHARQWVQGQRAEARHAAWRGGLPQPSAHAEDVAEEIAVPIYLR